MAKKIFAHLLVLLISIALASSLLIMKKKLKKVLAKPQIDDSLTKFIGGYDLNAVVNGLINSKQDMLQQLRPARPVGGATAQIVTLTGAFGPTAATGPATAATGEGPLFITLAGGETTVNGQGVGGAIGRPIATGATGPVQVIGTGPGTGGIGLGQPIQVLQPRPGANKHNRRPFGSGSVFVVQIP